MSTVTEGIIVKCPHCKGIVVVQELNCHIFRHGTYKNDFQQVNPHLPKNDCDKLFLNNEIYGCCKPFEIIYKNNKMFAVICDYK